MNNNPIGIFDSGLGGLSVWQEIAKLLPEEHLIYYADSANCPYGEKPTTEIRVLCEKIVDFLLAENCKMVVVACNTATAAAIRGLRAQYALPIVGMEPAIKPAALHTKTGNVGILATQGTLAGALFKQTRDKFAHGVTVYTQIGYGLVELVEQGKQYSSESFELLQKYINPMLEKNIDQLVLGCTHYPFFIPVIEKIVPSRVQVINPSLAVAKRVKDLLLEFRLYAETGQIPSYKFYTNGEEKLLRKFIPQVTEKQNYEILNQIP